MLEVLRTVKKSQTCSLSSSLKRYPISKLPHIPVPKVIELLFFTFSLIFIWPISFCYSTCSTFDSAHLVLSNLCDTTHKNVFYKKSHDLQALSDFSRCLPLCGAMTQKA
ncbi:hypothetical protein ACKWTF_014856 [Chironomus riparius]